MFLSWGRKDGFPGADGSTIIANSYAGVQTIPLYSADGNKLTEGSTGVRKIPITTDGVVGADNTSLTYVIKNPLTFIYNNTTPYDWYTANALYQNNALWNNGLSAKSNYDPCPKGWHIPQKSTWDDFSVNNFHLYIQGVTTEQGASGDYYQSNGRLYQEQTWYPTSGQISKSGSIGGVGFGGYVHTSSINNTLASCFRFVLNAVTPNDVSYRIYGISIRCIQE